MCEVITTIVVDHAQADMKELEFARGAIRTLREVLTMRGIACSAEVVEVQWCITASRERRNS